MPGSYLGAIITLGNVVTCRLFFADVFVPHRGVLRDVGRQHADAFFGAQVDDFNTILSQPIDSTAEIHRLPDDHGPNSELPDQTAAIPARGEGCDHNLVAITSLAAHFSKGVGLPMCGRIALLHPPVVALSEESSFTIKQCGADGNSSFAEPGARLIHCNLQHGKAFFPTLFSFRAHCEFPCFPGPWLYLVTLVIGNIQFSRRCVGQYRRATAPMKTTARCKGAGPQARCQRGSRYA